ncbi:hypothetical protein DACRYDRAFT_23749 [Dacryopinax primogenitus]|uniref:Uncharacterized protein n=1 Tax=Dacryopinax primogenitus (strain DJM 731) TaxID=1858805 RepID=M5FU67_DACPD|nr:uncharacterized protein DACRYDRAFT_23749 [Dacryopinax primogenitus]EJT99718.1 hypothetical protein DACRYDRAFT_23749 [Dacryopinax primogenitus]
MSAAIFVGFVQCDQTWQRKGPPTRCTSDSAEVTRNMSEESGLDCIREAGSP